MDDQRILSIKEKPFQNILPSEEVGVSLSKSTIKIDFTRANAVGSRQGSIDKTLTKTNKKTSKKARPLLEKHSLDG